MLAFLDWKMAVDVIVAIAAFVGMGLGVFNLIRELHQDRVKLRVSPKQVVRFVGSSSGKQHVIVSDRGWNPRNETGYIAIEVVNRGRFPITISEVGFIGRKRDARMVIPEPLTNEKHGLPLRLEARDSVTLYGEWQGLQPQVKSGGLKKAYVETACGHWAGARNRVLKDLESLILEQE